MRFIVTIVVLALAATAAADSGQQHSERGQTLYRDGKYREAHAEFAAGYEASKLPAFVFNMAECSRLAGDIETARGEYTSYLSLEPGGKLAPLAKQRLAALPGSATVPPAPAAPPPAAPPAQKPIPAPAVAAEHVEAKRAPTPPTPIDEPTPVWKRKSVWIVIGAAFVAGTVATIAITHHSECAGMCLDWTK